MAMAMAMPGTRSYTLALLDARGKAIRCGGGGVRNGNAVVFSKQLLLLQSLAAAPGSGKQRRALVCRAGLEEFAPATAAAYGLTLFGGGLTSYARTGSKGSLVGGFTGGIALALAYFLMLNPETKDLANAIAFGAAFLFIAVFGIRLAATKKPVPAGLLMAISIAASVVFVNAYFDARLH